MSKAEKKKRGREAREAQRKAEKNQKLLSRIMWIGIPVLAVVGLITFGIIRQNNKPPFDPMADLKPANVQGDPAAPITIMEFGDFG